MAFYTIYERNPVTGGDQNGWNLRQVVPVKAYALGAPPTGEYFKLTFRGASSGAMNFALIYIGHASTAPGTDLIDFDATAPAQVLVSTSASFAAGVDSTLNTPAYAWSKLKPLLTSVHVTFPGNVPGVADPDIFYCGATEPASGAGNTNATPHFSTPIPPGANAQCIFPKVEVWFSDPAGAPTCTVDPAPGQVSPTAASQLKFRTNWNKGVAGLTVGDIDLSTSTATFFGTPGVTVVDGEFAQEITITGMMTSGNVTVRIPAGSVTAVADGIPNAVAFTGSIAWDANLVDPHKPHFDELTIVTKDMLCIEFRDPVVDLGYDHVLTTPDTGPTGVFPITGVVDNGFGMPRVTCAEIAAVNGHTGNTYITAMTASPVSNGAGGQKIRCTIYDTALVLGGGRTNVQIRHARGTLEANVNYLYDSRTDGTWPDWSFTIINSTQFDLNYRRHYVAGVGMTDDLTYPSAFVNTYQGGGVILFADGSGQYRVPIHSVGGCTEINGSWPYARSSLTTIDLYNVSLTHTWTPGTGYCIQSSFPTPSFLRPNPAKGGQDDYCVIAGRTGKRRRFQDRRPLWENGDYLNRPASAVAADYHIIGAATPTVTAVYRKSQAYSAGFDNYTGAGLLMPIVTFKHKTYLKLNANMVNGNYTIIFPPGINIAPKSFTYNDKLTRCRAIHSDNMGHRVNDHKYAYLSEWVPEYEGDGPNGEVSFADITNWYLINDAGTVLWTSPGPPVLRCTATSQEGTGPNSDAVPYNPGQYKVLQTMGKPIKIDNVTRTNPGVVTVRNSADFARLSNGDMITFSDVFHQGVGGMTTLEYYFTVASKGVDGTNKFRLAPPRKYPDPDGLDFDYSDPSMIGDPDCTNRPSDVPPHPVEAWAVNSMDKGNWLYKVNYKASRASTNVYGLDFSTYTTPGTVYIYLPGRGRSDPIYIAESRWHTMWKLYQKAMYHQRSGIALDGRFGTTRPLNMKHRPEQQLYYSHMPYCLSNYSLNQVYNHLWDTGAPNGVGGGYDPWITETPVLAFGGHHDAGDYDVRINEMWLSYFNILQYWSALPTATRVAFTRAQAGTPTCLEAGLDPTTFAGTDDLPAPIAEVIWGIEPQRLSQIPTGQPKAGAVIGGFNYGEGVPDREGSWDLTYQVYAWAYDHQCTMNYCCVAAKLAKVLLDLGYTALGNVYAASATAAWDSFNSLGTGGGEDYTCIDAAYTSFYAPTIAKAHYTAAEFDKNLHFNAGVGNGQRNFDDIDHVMKGCAAASMFALTGGATYKAYCDLEYPPGAYAAQNVAGAFEYSEAPGATAATVTLIRNSLPGRCTDYFLKTTEDNTISYTFGMGRGDWNMSWGRATNWQESMHTLALVAIMDDRGHVPTGIFGTGLGARCRTAISKISTFRHGGNQQGICMTNGAGVRHLRESLHLDSRNQGQALPLGICSEGWAKDFPSYGSVFTVNGNTWFGAIQTPEFDPSNVPTDPTIQARETFPFATLCFPHWEKLTEFHYAIEHMEYTTQQQISPAYGVSMYMQAFDGNTALEAGLAVSTAVLVSSGNPSVVGAIVTYTCTVTGASGTPTGTVVFRDNGTLVTTLPLTAGSASLPITMMTAGAHTMSASYSGDTVYDPSTGTVVQDVTSATGTTIKGRLRMRMELTQ